MSRVSNVRRKPNRERTVRQESGPERNVCQELGPESTVRHESGLDNHVRHKSGRLCLAQNKNLTQADCVSIMPTPQQSLLFTDREARASGSKDPKDPNILWATPYHVIWRREVWELPACSFGTAFCKPSTGSHFYLLAEKYGCAAQLLQVVMVDSAVAEVVLPFHQVSALDLFVAQRADATRAGRKGVPVFVYRLVYDQNHPRRCSVQLSQKVFSLHDQASARAAATPRHAQGRNGIVVVDVWGVGTCRVPKSMSVRSRVLKAMSVRSRVLKAMSIRSRVLTARSVRSRVLKARSARSWVLNARSVRSRVLKTTYVISLF